MSEIHTCTLVLEYNYSANPSESRGSVWLCNGDGTADVLRTEPPDKAPNWTKIAGPIDYAEAAAIHAALKKFFEVSGVSVIDEGITD